MHDIPVITLKGMCVVSRDLFKFWEISDNISLTVQDRDDSCTGTYMGKWGNRMWRRLWPIV